MTDRLDAGSNKFPGVGEWLLAADDAALADFLVRAAVENGIPGVPSPKVSVWDERMSRALVRLGPPLSGRLRRVVATGVAEWQPSDGLPLAQLLLTLCRDLHCAGARDDLAAFVHRTQRWPECRAVRLRAVGVLGGLGLRERHRRMYRALLREPDTALASFAALYRHDMSALPESFRILSQTLFDADRGHDIEWATSLFFVDFLYRRPSLLLEWIECIAPKLPGDIKASFYSAAVATGLRLEPDGLLYPPGSPAPGKSSDVVKVRLRLADGTVQDVGTLTGAGMRTRGLLSLAVLTQRAADIEDPSDSEVAAT